MQHDLSRTLKTSSTSGANRPERRWRRQMGALGLAVFLHLQAAPRVGAQNHADYRYESYQEDAGRIKVETQAGLFVQKLTSWLSLKGEVVYDAISGASPTGAPPPSRVGFVPPADGGPTGPFRDTVPLARMNDIRWAGNFEAGLTYGAQRLAPQFSYSEEHDYISYGGALNYAIDLNQKNTTLNAGWSHNSDEVLPKGWLRQIAHKNADDFMIGVNQLLSPKTVLTVDFTYGSARGYLDDQYKGVLFTGYPQYDAERIATEAEKRPSHRDHYVGFASLTQYVEPLRGSAEVSYRYYQDSYGVQAHTPGVAWHQKIGSRVMVSPLFRYYQQTAANFYATQFDGDPLDPMNTTAIPAYYSSDYRLSHLESWTYGIAVTARITDWLSLDASYKRYVMNGLDGVTSPSAYPSAHIITVGARLWF